MEAATKTARVTETWREPAADEVATATVENDEALVLRTGDGTEVHCPLDNLLWALIKVAPKAAAELFSATAQALSPEDLAALAENLAGTEHDATAEALFAKAGIALD